MKSEILISIYKNFFIKMKLEIMILVQHSVKQNYKQK